MKKIRRMIFIAILVVMVSATTAGAASRTYVASIGKKKYTTLQKAFNAVTNGQTVKLLKNVTLTKSVTLPAKKVKFTVNLNKHILKMKSNSYKPVFTFKKNNTVTLKNGTVYGTIESCGGTVTIKSGTFKKAYFNFYSKARLNIQGGTISNSTGQSIYLSDSKLVVSGGKLIYSGDVWGSGHITAERETSVFVKGGTIRGTNTVIYLDTGSTCKKTGGKVISSKGKTIVDTKVPYDPNDPDEGIFDEDV